ncbi:MAG: hypothetical protein ABSE62_00515 [Chthoniobacteraceae bacterium]
MSGAAQIRPGVGLRTVRTMMGFGMTSAGGGGSFLHPFYPTLNGIAGVQFSRGLVSYIEPTIEGVPISGMVNGVQGPPPVLPLDPNVIGAGDNRTWACAEITVDAKGMISPASTVVMAHRATWFLQDPLGKTGRCPVCMILWNGRVPSQIFHILYFNPVAQMVTLPTGGTGAGVVKFFFL